MLSVLLRYAVKFTLYSLGLKFQSSQIAPLQPVDDSLQHRSQSLLMIMVGMLLLLLNNLRMLHLDVRILKVFVLLLLLLDGDVVLSRRTGVRYSRFKDVLLSVLLLFCASSSPGGGSSSSKIWMTLSKSLSDLAGPAAKSLGEGIPRARS